uniref:Uncharacterized protein n=1 Tax=Strombidium inclinatum TaxID=197538 RepID=A0A7S3IPZ3_9SPIT|mmetsp:Transcript_32638/g.49894  ORF Transcript_32638/g.49894 Transcript_32638/m.49894 type:complete len:285 (+) Transcript_32638:313-1167(+)
MMACTSSVIGLILVTLNVFSFVIKLLQFHQFMMYPTKEYARFVSNPDFTRDALILTCLSLFLELFGHALISLLSSMGYFIYIGKKELLAMTIFFSLTSDLGRRFIGMKIGKRPFANYVAPRMSFEAALFAIFTPSVVAAVFYMLISYLGLHHLKFKMVMSDFITTFGNVMGGLSFAGYLLRSFFMRCAGIDENSSLYNVNKVSISAKPESEQEKEKRKIDEILKHSNLVLIWNKTEVFNLYFSIMLPLAYMFWYCLNGMEDQFDDDPFQVSMYTLVMRNLIKGY